MTEILCHLHLLASYLLQIRATICMSSPVSSHVKIKLFSKMANSVYLITFCVILPYLIILTQCYVCNDKSCATPCDTTSACFKSNTSRIIKKGSQCGCCDVCITQLKYNAPCQTENQNLIPTEECGPELTCDPSQKVCVYQKDQRCICESLIYDDLRAKGSIIVGKNKPKCNYLGYYDSVQCIPGSVCFCVNRDGERIFGTDYEVLEKSMMCNCSRDAYELRTALESSQILSYDDEIYSQNPPFAHCLPNGNYDPLQCVGENCYCLTKDLKMQGSVTGITIKETMLCYNPAYHDESYFRPCELERNDMLESMYNATQYDARIMGLDLPQCDLDGSYAPIQCRGDRCYCAHRLSGHIFAGYEAKRYSQDAEEMNCNCIRDSQYITDPTLKEQVQCTNLGNYAPIQCQGSLCYCVDINGIQQGGEVRRIDIQTLNCTTANEPPDCSTL